MNCSCHRLGACVRHQEKACPHCVHVPDNMVVVTKEEFFAYVGPRDISPSVLDSPYYSAWYTGYPRKLVGRTLPGWKSNHGDDHVYMLVKGVR